MAEFQGVRGHGESEVKKCGVACGFIEAKER
jgi:hypothetical protein